MSRFLSNVKKQVTRQGMQKRKGNIDVVGTITGVVLVSFMLIIGVSVFSQFESNIDKSDFTSSANTTIDKVATQTYSGFKIGAMIPYVMFAVAIIVVLIGAFSFARRE